MSPTMIEKVTTVWTSAAESCMSFTRSFKPLLICQLNLNWQIDKGLMQQLRENGGLLEAPGLRAAAKSQQVWLEDLSLHFLELLWCSSR